MRGSRYSQHGLLLSLTSSWRRCTREIARAPVIRKRFTVKNAVVRGITGPFNAVRACSECVPNVAGRAFFGIGTFTSDVGNCVVLRKVIQVVQIKAKLLALCWYRIRSKSTAIRTFHSNSLIVFKVVRKRFRD